MNCCLYLKCYRISIGLQVSLFAHVLHMLVYLYIEDICLCLYCMVLQEKKKKQRFPPLSTELCYLLSTVPLLHAVNTLANTRKCPNVGHSVFWKPSLKPVMSEPGQSRLSDFSSTVLVLIFTVIHLLTWSR